jgi:hypothetical protein
VDIAAATGTVSADADLLPATYDAIGADFAADPIITGAVTA